MINGYLESDGRVTPLPNEEEVLLRRATSGEGEAFGQLYLSHLDSIYRYIYFRVGEQADAEDLTEQVFLKAWEALPGYTSRGHPFSSWLYRIANNIVIDFWRRKKTVRLSELDEVNTLLDTHLTPIEQLLKTETLASLADSIRRLPDEQQQVIILRFIEGLSHTEVAHIMGKNEGACRALQYRALAALSRLMVHEGWK
ncbi:MAG: sigma-70 family RNA polymerase sigma factor [Ardenticatenales bacterium]|nr:sigma-70 family RNA polymerase sigma factor [Ardenticatenales bacterium]